MRMSTGGPDGNYTCWDQEGAGTDHIKVLVRGRCGWGYEETPPPPSDRG